MNEQKKEFKLYNVIFPFWMLMLFPWMWLAIFPANFLIDSAVLLVSLWILKLENKKQFYKKHIFKIFAFGMLADIIGALIMFVELFTEIFDHGDELFLTVPALFLAAALIFVFDYFISFRKCEKSVRLKLSLIFAIVTAPYTYLIPTSWMY